VYFLEDVEVSGMAEDEGEDVEDAVACRIVELLMYGYLHSWS
jgi:hypothetical protein